MKSGKIQRQLKAPPYARLKHVSALLPLAITSLTPNQALEDCGQVRQGIMVDPYDRLEGANSLPCCQTEEQKSHPNGKVPCPIQNGRWGISSAV
jgi:hypothetical protein